MPEIATIEAMSLSFMLLKSTLPMPRAGPFPVGTEMDPRDGEVVAGEEDDQEEVAGEREVDEREHRHDDIGLLELEDLGARCSSSWMNLTIRRAKVMAGPRGRAPSASG